MIWIFDLDETLYNEKTFVVSGFRAVALQLSKTYSIPKEDLLRIMEVEFSTRGRSKVFQRVKEEHPEIKNSIKELVEVYRSHVPEIQLYPDASDLLTHLTHETLFLVTDGARTTQRNKISALDLETVFKGIFVTDEHGLNAPKPGIKCFQMIKKICQSEWRDMVYIADDPHKDFINLKPVGMRTVRVNRGRFSGVFLDKAHEADILVNDLSEVRSKLRQI
jgi:putative hydrolase of the HAD superfamily